MIRGLGLFRYWFDARACERVFQPFRLIASLLYQNQNLSFFYDISWTREPMKAWSIRLVKPKVHKIWQEMKILTRFPTDESDLINDDFFTKCFNKLISFQYHPLLWNGNPGKKYTISSTQAEKSEIGRLWREISLLALVTNRLFRASTNKRSLLHGFRGHILIMTAESWQWPQKEFNREVTPRILASRRSRRPGSWNLSNADHHGNL